MPLTQQEKDALDAEIAEGRRRLAQRYKRYQKINDAFHVVLLALMILGVLGLGLGYEYARSWVFWRARP